MCYAFCFAKIQKITRISKKKANYFQTIFKNNIYAEGMHIYANATTRKDFSRVTNGDR